MIRPANHPAAMPINRNMTRFSTLICHLLVGEFGYLRSVV
jgi:hypothetical protein